ncbi:MAG: transcriptional regulator [Methylomarinum sp.]|nr:transcriptional regulator [Methylomarinum sp.]
MRIICPHCGSKAVISSSNKLSNQVKDLYCQCENTIHCGAGFVSTLAYKHTINPPAHTVLEMAMSLLNSLSKEEKAELQRDCAR